MRKIDAKTVHDIMAGFGSLGGKKRAKNLTATERRQIAKQGAAARWGKRKKGEARLRKIKG